MPCGEEKEALVFFSHGFSGVFNLSDILYNVKITAYIYIYRYRFKVVKEIELSVFFSFFFCFF